MVPTLSTPSGERTRLLSIGFINFAHAIDHYVMLILATVVIPTGLGLAPTRLALGRAVDRLKRLPPRAWPLHPWREKYTARLAREKRK